MSAAIECIATSVEGTPEVSLWECPCRECTKMAWEGSDSPDTLQSYRIEWWSGWYGCTSDDPNNHQGDTCPIHETSAGIDHREGFLY